MRTPKKPNWQLPTGPGRSLPDTVGALLTVSAQPAPTDTLNTCAPLTAIMPASVPSAINRMASEAGEKFGEHVGCSAQSIAWSGKLGRNSVSTSVAARNPSQGVARGDCRQSVDARRCMQVVGNHGANTPAVGCTCDCAARKSPFRRHTFAMHSERRAPGTPGRITAYRKSSFLGPGSPPSASSGSSDGEV